MRQGDRRGKCILGRRTDTDMTFFFGFSCTGTYLFTLILHWICNAYTLFYFSNRSQFGSSAALRRGRHDKSKDHSQRRSSVSPITVMHLVEANGPNFQNPRFFFDH
jgi:hypothetical protein